MRIAATAKRSEWGLGAARTIVTRRQGTTLRSSAHAQLMLQRTHGNRFVQRLVNGAAIQRQCACGGTCVLCRSESAHQEQKMIQSILQQDKSRSQPLSVEKGPVPVLRPKKNMPSIQLTNEGGGAAPLEHRFTAEGVRVVVRRSCAPAQRIWQARKAGNLRK